ncbi:hypothetical protein EVAR_100321_1 [Eumeta japonica]|uniref:Uncharacterized protein n=1 Tax=Eumeta variegata TaxID=151549 RepID=A0A4C1ZRQ2_EUMVA|nr:hypothetical protein EVAR_100321_1 [Eumeta japonica]
MTYCVADSRPRLSQFKILFRIVPNVVNNTDSRETYQTVRSTIHGRSSRRDQKAIKLCTGPDMKSTNTEINSQMKYHANEKQFCPPSSGHWTFTVNREPPPRFPRRTILGQPQETVTHDVTSSSVYRVVGMFHAVTSSFWS